ncbi:MAG: anaerobic glycerol-3-phosphate dehydrogenase subunit B [Bacteroidales bacterium]|nr:anaerobic glycerol-3-phosphate dehydrogenase subunit B [Bacteroidales bacterium]
MHFDSIIIGGGLSGLVCGLKLQRAGHKCVIVSTGQNAMHFSSGAFGLLARLPDGTPVEEPLKALSALPEAHPYRKIGLEKMTAYVHAVRPLFASCGVPLTGEEERNQFMVSPTGNYKSAWLALSDVTLLPDKESRIGEKALIVNLKGYLDFNTAFIAEGLEKRGTSCRIEALDLPEFARLRTSPSEMRSVNIARVLESPDVVDAFALAVCNLLKDEDTVILPSVFGLRGGACLVSIRERIPVNTVFIGTMPPSVPGIRSQLLLKKAFEAAGGTFLSGDQARDAEFDGDRVMSLRTENLGTLRLTADHFILATGSFFSKGLWATPERVVEPLMGLDVEADQSRMDWYDRDFFAEQRYIGFGVRTDERFHPMREGRPVENLYAIGSVVGNCNSVKLGCGAGVALMTALTVADEIIHE